MEPRGVAAAPAASRTRPLGGLLDAALPPALAVAFASALALFVAYPIGRVLLAGVTGDTGLTWARYRTFLTTAYFLVSFRNSLILATGVSLVALVAGFAVAHAVTRGPAWLRRPVRLVTLLPLVAPSYVFGVALLILGGRRGVINHLLGTDLRILGWPGVVVGQALALFPIAYLVIESLLATVDRSLEDSASDLGASGLQVLRTITLPLLTPGLVRAGLMVFALSMADFSTPAVLGGGLPFLAQDALLLVVGAEYDLPMAAVLCTVLMVPSLAVFLGQHRWLARRSYVTMTGREGSTEARPRLPLVDRACLAVALVTSLAVVVPMGVVVVGALTRFVGVNNALTFEHVTNLRGIRSLDVSLRLATASSLPVGGLGLLLAYLLARFRFPGRRALEAVALLGFALPGTVLGIGYVLAFNEAPVKLTGTFWILVLSCVFHYLAAGVEIGLAKLAQIDATLEEASVDLGASRLGTFVRVVLPLMGPAFLAAVTYAFVNGMLTLSALVFLISPGREPASSVIFAFARMGELGHASALSLLLVGVVLLVLGGVKMATRWSGWLPTEAAR